MIQNIATIWEAIATRADYRLALACGDRVRTWGELDARASRLATALSALGLKEGSLVAVDLWNSIESVESLFAAFKIRAVPFLVNYRYREAELAYLLNDSRAEAIIYDSALSERVKLATETAGHRPHRIECGDASDVGALSYEELIASSPPAKPIVRDANDEVVVYTGGTTGHPKGVVWSHFEHTGGSSLSAELDLDLWIDQCTSRPPTVSLVVPPIMHASGFSRTIRTLVGAGSVVFCASRSLDADEVLTLLEHHHISTITIIGDAFGRPILEALERARAAGRPYDLSSLVDLHNTGVILSPTVKRDLLSHGRFSISDGLSSTEGSNFATVVTSAGDKLAGAQFRLGPNTKIVSEAGELLDPRPGVEGYVATTGRLPKGYLNDTEKTSRTFPTINGTRYCIPGDMVRIEADGLATLLGRGSEVINTGGEKVFVEEVEQVILTHPDVADAVVIGVADPRWGHRIGAIVAPRMGAVIDEQTIIDHVGACLADHKRPRQVVVASVPRSIAGKADRAAARAILEAVAPAR